MSTLIWRKLYPRVASSVLKFLEWQKNTLKIRREEKGWNITRTKSKSKVKSCSRIISKRMIWPGAKEKMKKNESKKEWLSLKPNRWKLSFLKNNRLWPGRGPKAWGRWMLIRSKQNRYWITGNWMGSSTSRCCWEETFWKNMRIGCLKNVNRR